MIINNSLNRPLRTMSACFVLILAGCNQAAPVGTVPTTAQSLFERAEILLERDETDEAIDVLTKAIGASPDDPRYYNERGIAYEQMGEDAKAEADYTTAIEIDPEFGRAYNNRAAVRARSGRLDEAVLDLSKAVKLDPDVLLTFQNRSLAYFELEKFPEALADLDEADRIERGNAVNAYRRGQILRAMGKFDESLATLDRALNLAEQDGVGTADLALIRSEKARVLRDLGRNDEARAEFRETARLDPSLGTVLEAEALERTMAIHSGLQQAGFEISGGEPLEGFDLSASLAGVSRPVLVAESISDSEFQLSHSQASLIREHPDALIAIANNAGGPAAVVPATELSEESFRPIAFAIRRPDAAPQPE